MPGTLMTPTEYITLPDSYCVPSQNDSVLIAEDDTVCRMILQTWLKTWGYRVVVAKNGIEASDILQQEDSPELLILDWVMPGIDGLELCRRVRQRQQNAYILLVTANDKKQEIVNGLEAGADDYLTKPFDPDELRARLRVGQRMLSLHQQLRFQATHDTLTGIWSRGASLDMLRRELERAARTQTSTGVLMLDLDRFKNINDTLGHLSGDGVLKEVVRCIAQTVRAYDVVGRYGGEEFLIVLPGCDRDKIHDTAERIRTTVAGSPVHVAGSEIFATVSIGGAVAPPGKVSAREILAHADAALYRAKAAGRNCVAMHDVIDKSNASLT
jgi:two-component system cell cycle response regulator